MITLGFKPLDPKVTCARARTLRGTRQFCRCAKVQIDALSVHVRDLQPEGQPWRTKLQEVITGHRRPPPVRPCVFSVLW